MTGSVPNGGTITQGQIWTAAQWITAWQSKADDVGIANVISFGADPTGLTDSTAAFTAALAAGGPVYVPWTANFYAVTALSGAQIMPLWGPGLIKIAGVAQPISSQADPGITSAAASGTVLPALTPASNTPGGSVGYGAQFNLTTRSGGTPQYGNVLDEYLVTANIGAAQFDVGDTSWVTATNITGGGQLFASWDGANTPSSALGEAFTGGGVIGREINVGNRWADFGLQTDVGGTRYTVGLQLVPDVVPTTDTAQSAVTMTSGSPGMVNWTAHGLPANTPVTFSGPGTLPAALTAGSVYYVLAAGLTTNAFEVSATIGGSAINFATSSTGSLFAIPSFPGSFASAIGPSIHAHKWWVGNLVRADSIMPGGHTNLVYGGAVSTADVPADWVNFNGFWQNGIDMSAASFSGLPFKMPPFISNGYGTPINALLVPNFPGSAATLAQCGEMISYMILTFTNILGLFRA